MYINFSDLPGQQNLFLDYLYEYENVKDYYNDLNFRHTDSYNAIFSKLKNYKRTHRNLLPQIIKEQYEGLTLSQQTSRNIDQLKHANTIAVVTGQQLGLFGGPMYTFYKTMTAIKLCTQLKEKFDEYNFVPVFWMEGDDHDFEEVRSIKLIDQANEVIKITYTDNIPTEINRGSVGNISFNEEIKSVNDQISSLLRDSDFKTELIQTISKFYTDGKTFKQAFKGILHYFFDEYGLVLFDPQDIKIKQLLKNVYKKEVEDFRIHTNELVKRSAMLEEIYHAQVKVNPLNLFYSDEDGRFLLEPVDEVFRLKGRRKRFTKEELLKLIDTQPEKFSANVLLRPICQDYLFPTAFYIAGPAEISYFAQLIPLYKFYNITQPILYPRSSATVLEKGIAKIIQKYDLSLQDIFIYKDQLYEKTLKKYSDYDIDELFDRYSGKINEVLDELREVLQEIDKLLNEGLNKTREKTLQGLELLKNRTLASEKKKNEAMVRQLGRISNVIYPDSSLQERELNFIYFAHKYGLEFIKLLYNDLTINRFEHQIIEV